MKIVNEDSFKTEVLDIAGVSLVECGATWCVKCKAMIPVINNIAKNNPELNIVEIDIDDCPNLSKQFSIKGVPTTLIFKGGELVGRSAGVVAEAKIMDLVNK